MIHRRQTVKGNADKLQLVFNVTNFSIVREAEIA